MAEITINQKVDKLMYTIFGNGVPGITGRVELLEKSFEQVAIHHAGECHMIELAIEAAFEKRFGKKNNSILIFVSIAGLVISAITVILAFIALAVKP